MEIANELMNFFGIEMFNELTTFPELIFICLKIFVGVWIVSFIISSLFRLIGYTNQRW